MKKFLFIFVAVIVSSTCFAKGDDASAKKETKSAEKPAEKSGEKFAREYGMAGCGLGAVIIGKHGGQIFASTTNGTFSNQLFGISSGTLNCIDSASSVVASRADYYIQANRFALEADVARGNGETLAGLSQIFSCKSSEKFGNQMQKNFSKIFVRGSVTNEVTDAVINVIRDSQDLGSDCLVI